MEEVKKTKEYCIYKKKSGRYAIQDSKGQMINGKHKSEILFAEKLIKTPPPRTEAPVIEAPAPEVAAIADTVEKDSHKEAS